MSNITDETLHIATEISKLHNAQAIVAIDGVNGSGKSSLSRNLADALTADLFELDLYIKGEVSQERDYASSICYDNLKNDVSKSIASCQITIIEGICILDVLQNANIHPDFTIYVDKISKSSVTGIIHGKSSDIENEDVSRSCTISYPLSIYHKKRHPRINATLVFEWTHTD